MKRKSGSKLIPSKHINCFRGHKYALDCVSGKQVAGKYIIGACKRYLQDIENDKDFFWMDWDAAEKYLRSVQKFEHVIGKWKTPNIVYDPWQCWLWMNVMGFKNKITKFRRFRVAHAEISRGNSKSAMSSQCGLYFLALDNPVGNQISTVATKKDQARIVLDSSRAMAKKSKSFRKFSGCRVLAHTIIHPKSNSVMRAMSADYSGLDGLNDVLAICDELHAMNRDVFEVIYSGMSKRQDSLTLCITTAGKDIHSVGFSQSSYAKKVAMGEFIDDQFFSAVYTIDDDDQWDDESIWVKANPGLGVCVDLESLRSKVAKAKVTPADIPNIKIKHMNQWISEAMAFFDLAAWDKCYDPKLKLENFSKEDARLGIDLASHIDLTSIAIVFKKEGVYYVFDKSFIPEETIVSSRNVLYQNCVKDGHLIPTKGSAINYEFIQEQAGILSDEFNIKECLYDPWNATETAQRLSNKIEMVKMAMNVSNLSEPMKKFDAAIRQGNVRHNGSPLLRWCLGNVVAKEDHNGNVFPRKSHEKLKIDPVVAILMAMAGWGQDDDGDSVYEERGIRVL